MLLRHRSLWQDEMTNIDYAILNFIQAHIANSFLDAVMPWITKIGDEGIVFIITGVVLLFFKKYRKSGIVMLLGMLIGSLICNLWLKNFVARPRPFEGLEDIALLIPMPSSYSFPSGHTTSAFEFAFALALINKKAAIAGYVIAALVAFSRLYLYVHFPSDILGGIIVGTISSLCALFIYNSAVRLIASRQKIG